MLSFNFDKNELTKGKSIFSTQVKINNDSINENKSQLIKENDKEEELVKFLKNIISMNISMLKGDLSKDYIQFQNHINESIQSYEIIIRKISDYQSILIEQFSNIKIKTDKIENFSDKLEKIDDKLTIYEIRLNNLLKEFKEAVNKYDSLFLDNMSVPGKIGKFCKFKNISEFLSYSYDKLNQLDIIKESNISKMKSYKEKIETLIKKVNSDIELLREENIQINSKKLNFLEKKINEDINEIKKKIELFPNQMSFFNIENKINNLMNNYNDIKNNKELYDKIATIENDLEKLKTNKNPNNNAFYNNKNIKVIYSNISGKKLNSKTFYKEEKLNKKNKKASKSSKNIIRLDYLKKNIEVKKQQSLKLDNINEEFDENNDNSPLNNMLIKSVKFSPKRKSVNSEYSLNLNEKNSEKLERINNSFKDNTFSHSLDSSYNYDKKDNIIEGFIDEKKKEEMNNNKNNNEVKRSISLGDKNKSKFSYFSSRTNIKINKNKKKIIIKPKIKSEISPSNEEKINKKKEIPKGNRREKSNIKNYDFIKSHSENKKIKYLKKINPHKNQNTQKAYNKTELESKEIDSENIKIFNNNEIKKYLNYSSNEKTSKTIIKSNNSYENQRIKTINNNNYSSLILFDKRSKLNNFKSFSHKNIKKNNYLSIKNTYYHLFRLESIKKDEIKKNNNNQNIFHPQEIPIISNFSMKKTSNSEKKPKREKLRIIIKNKNNYKKNLNLELKIIPANFKESKKIQVE